MKRIGMALGALTLLTAGFAPLAAVAAKAELAPISQADKDKGMKEAPAVVAGLKLACEVSEARFIGNLTLNSKDGKPAGGPAYEVACKAGGGYSILNKQPDPIILDCLAASESGALACRLPGNADPKQGLKPYLATAGRTCTIANAKYLGATPAGVTFYEAACSEGAGYVIQTPPRGSAGAAVWSSSWPTIRSARPSTAGAARRPSAWSWCPCSRRPGCASGAPCPRARTPSASTRASGAAWTATRAPRQAS